MGSSLRDIPGAGGRRGGLGRLDRGPASRSWRPPPRQSGPAERRRRLSGLSFHPRIPIDRFNLVLALAFVAVALVGGIWLWRANGVTVTSEGLQDGEAVTPSASRNLTIDLHLEPTSRLESARLRLDGEDITDDTEVTDDGFHWVAPAGGMEEGSYELSVEVPRAVFGTATWSMVFDVDQTPPVISFVAPDPVAIDEALTVTGSVDEIVELTAEDEPVPVSEDGRFEVTFPTPPAGSVALAAVDRAGNVENVAVPVVVRPPTSRGLHLSASAWNDDAVRDAALELVEAGDLDTVVLDLKDECGVVTYGSEVAVAGQAGAVDEQLDLAEAVEAVHDAGGRVVGRLVVFRDPLLARWGWANGHPDWVLQDTANDPWPAYGDGAGCPAAESAEPIVGGFTNVASPAVWTYNTDLAVEAAAAGVDDIVLDDVRRPDGDLSFMQAVGVQGGIPDALVAFLGQARDRVRAEGAYLGATVTGTSTRDPSVYDQHLGAMAAAVDYLAPELASEASVGGALRAALAQLQARSPMVPWLAGQEGTAQAQVNAVGAAGACSWVLTDPDFTYPAGIDPAC
jgi:hypothetical protein